MRTVLVSDPERKMTKDQWRFLDSMSRLATVACEPLLEKALLDNIRWGKSYSVTDSEMEAAILSRMQEIEEKRHGDALL